MPRVSPHRLLSLRCLSTAELGFRRPGFGRETLVGTVQPYERHVFLSYGSPDTWHANVEAQEGLPRSLSMAIMARKAEIKKKTRLTIYQGNGSDSSDGDVLIFPDMVKYRKLTHGDVNKFIEEILITDTNHTLKNTEIINPNNSYIFICSHGARDGRCGVCGPVLVRKFQEEINGLGLADRAFVGPCSHTGGHKYAGNVIIFGPGFDRESESEIEGHWYGYVSPDEVKNLVEQHIKRGIIVEKLWRGQMGLSKEDQKIAQNVRLQLNSQANQTKQR